MYEQAFVCYIYIYTHLSRFVLFRWYLPYCLVLTSVSTVLIVEADAYIAKLVCYCMIIVRVYDTEGDVREPWY